MRGTVICCALLLFSVNLVAQAPAPLLTDVQLQQFVDFCMDHPEAFRSLPGQTRQLFCLGGAIGVGNLLAANVRNVTILEQTVTQQNEIKLALLGFQDVQRLLNITIGQLAGDIQAFRTELTDLQIRVVAIEAGTPPTPPPPTPTDTIPPTVSLNSPLVGAILTGTVTLSAAASDAVGVVGVQFFLNSAPLGAEATSSPFQTIWDTRTSTDSSHILSVNARDAAGNIGSSMNITVSVANTVPPPQPPPSTTVTQILFSLSPDRSNSSLLDGVTVGGNIFVFQGINGFVATEPPVNSIQYFLDGSLIRTENFAPFDLQGSENPLNTLLLANGAHNLTSQVLLSNGTSETVTADFTVNN